MNAADIQNMVYAFQASMFRALEAKGTHIFSIIPPFCPKKIKLCAHDKNMKREEPWVKVNLLHVFVMYTLHSAHEKFVL